MYIVLNKAGLNLDIPRNNVPIIRKVIYLLRKGGKMRDVLAHLATFYAITRNSGRKTKCNVICI